jgi:Neutral/alkaline non-lysosomal ceramidase, N-terminal
MHVLQFGTAVRDITPGYPVWMHGYSDRDHRSDGIAEPLFLGCLAIGNGDVTVLLITCDLIGLQDHVCERLCDLLEHETGIGYPDVLLSCSHTHFAPALQSNGYRWPQPGIVDPDPRFVADFEAKLIEVAQESLRNMQRGQLERARVSVPQVSFNRRTVKADGSVETNFVYPGEPRNYTFSPVDPELTVLRLTDSLGVKAVLANFGCHPVTGGETRGRDHYRISSDYVFYLRQTIAQHHACPVFFTLGAAGDAVPINRYGDCRQRIGSVLGNAAILAERTFAVEDSAEVKADWAELDVKTITDTDPGAAQAEFDRSRAAFLALINDPQAKPDGEAWRAASAAYDQAQTALLRSRLYPDNRHTVRIQFLRVGATVFVGLPFEVLSEISTRMKKQFPQSVLVSCAGGYQGYLPLAYEYPRGGYEAGANSTHFEPGTADRLLDIVLDKLRTWGPQ